MSNTIRTTALVAALAALPALAMGQQPDPEAMARGGKLYSETCARCHNPRPATERGDRAWSTIVLHMRARANLTKSDADAILVFLKAVNRDDGSTASRDPSLGDGLAAELAAWRLGGLGVSAPSPMELDSPVEQQLVDYVEKLRARSAPER